MLNVNISEMVRDSVNNAWNDFRTFLYLPSNVIIAKIILRDTDPIFEELKFETLRFWYLPTNGTIKKVVPHGTDTLSESENNWNVN